MDLLNNIVRDMLIQHEGGEVFFDHLDEAVKHESIIDQLIELTASTGVKNLIVSGKFGYFMSDYLADKHKGFPIVLLVNGGLRQGRSIDDLSCVSHLITGEDFIFIDDSFYSGKTRDAVRDEIERLGGRLKLTYVVYDGSLFKDPGVVSLYRYYEEAC